MSVPRLIAFYLPQFYPTPENDEWWSPGFTEWTNVGNAKPLFKGHYQPRVPADLGYYDLRVSDVREQQAMLAQSAGIEGFCYWHYWFAGRRLLDRVFTEVLQSGSPDYPFCLCWANHSWYQKTWDANKPDKLLIEQTYPGKDDFVAHFYSMLPAFQDRRYMKVKGKILFGLYDVISMSSENIKLFIDTWNDLAKENGLGGFCFFGFTYKTHKRNEILDKGLEYVVCDYLMDAFDSKPFFKRITARMIRSIFHIPNKVIDYNDYSRCVLNQFNPNERVFPCLNPNFDHSPRSAERAHILHKSTPQKWSSLLSETIKRCSDRNTEDNLIFVKAWNEWGEGNYMEPDLRFGRGYIEATRQVIDNIDVK